MKKSAKSKNAAPKIDPYLEGLMSKLIDRLVAVEKKLDLVVSQTSGRHTSSGGPAGISSVAPPAAPTPPPRRDRTLYEAICADCSKVCEVPFKPTEGRAVYCKECWARRKSGGSNGKPPHGMPVLTPVAVRPKVSGKLGLPPVSLSAAPPKKSKKSSPAQKNKKKK